MLQLDDRPALTPAPETRLPPNRPAAAYRSATPPPPYAYSPILISLRYHIGHLLGTGLFRRLPVWRAATCLGVWPFQRDGTLILPPRCTTHYRAVFYHGILPAGSKFLTFSRIA